MTPMEFLRDLFHYNDTLTDHQVVAEIFQDYANLRAQVNRKLPEICRHPFAEKTDDPKYIKCTECKEQLRV